MKIGILGLIKSKYFSNQINFKIFFWIAGIKSLKKYPYKYEKNIFV